MRYPQIITRKSPYAWLAIALVLTFFIWACGEDTTSTPTTPPAATATPATPPRATATPTPTLSPSEPPRPIATPRPTSTPQSYSYCYEHPHSCTGDSYKYPHSCADSYCNLHSRAHSHQTCSKGVGFSTSEGCSSPAAPAGNSAGIRCPLLIGSPLPDV